MVNLFLLMYDPNKSELTVKLASSESKQSHTEFFKEFCLI